MNMPYICLLRTDIPEGILQVLDLWPNTSQRNPAMDPPGQTRYVSFQPQNNTVVTTGATRIVSAAYYGIAAYLIDHIVSGGLIGGTAPLSDTNANNCAIAILARARAGYPMTEVMLDTYLSTVIANTGFATGGSTGVVQDMLAILSGDRYLLPALVVLDNGAGTKIPKDGDHSTITKKFDAVGLNTPQCDATFAALTWTATRDIHVTKGILDAGVTLDLAGFALYYSESFVNNGTIINGAVVDLPVLEVAGGFVTPSRIRKTYDGLALNASCAEGKLSVLKSAAFEYLDVTGAALVVYSDTGSVM
jgi:hypothetical protein